VNIQTATKAHAGLLAWLRRHHVDYELHEHELTFTARQTARAEGVDPHTFAKVVGVLADEGTRVLVVVDATDRLDLHKAREALGARSVRLLDEVELDALAPSCERGAIPAVGDLFGLPLYADHAVRADREISFNAGSHEVSVRVDREAWEQATGVRYADLAENLDRRPAWTWS